MESKIPKRLHLVWFGDKPMPEISHETFKISEGWSVFLWHERTMFFRNELSPNDHELINRFNLPVQKSDATRLLAVYKYGGVYMDFDFDYIKPIDELLNCPAFVGREDDLKLCNAIFGAVPGHPAIKAQIDKLHEMPTDKRVWGVKLMTDTVVNNPQYPVVIYPQEYFYPYSWNEENPENKRPKPNTYLMHRWEKSWWKK